MAASVPPRECPIRIGARPCPLAIFSSAIRSDSTLLPRSPLALPSSHHSLRYTEKPASVRRRITLTSGKRSNMSRLVGHSAATEDQIALARCAKILRAVPTLPPPVPTPPTAHARPSRTPPGPPNSQPHP